MDRRWFMQLAAGVPALAREVRPTPAYRPVTTYKPGPANSGMPGAFPGRLSSVHRADSIDPELGKGECCCCSRDDATGDADTHG